MIQFNEYDKLFVIDGTDATVQAVRCADGWYLFSTWAVAGSRMMLADGGAVTCFGAVCEHGGTWSR